jgi:hypothetical protein
MPSPRPRPRSRSIAFVAPVAGFLNVAIQLAGCASHRGTPVGPAPVEAATVRATDCERWTDHTLAVVMTAFDEATQDCPHAMRNRMFAAVEKGRPEVRRSTLERCERHLGERYDEGAAACYERAVTLPALHECHFDVAGGAEGSSQADPFAKVRGVCEKARRGEPRPSTPVRATELPFGTSSAAIGW